MSRPSHIFIDSTALLHNVRCVQSYAPEQKIIAMVKANAYGCGLSNVVPILEGHVDAFGVASVEEAVSLRELGSRSPCVLIQGLFDQTELLLVDSLNLECVIHHEQQLQWILNVSLSRPLKVWVKINTGMNRLGFPPEKVPPIIKALSNCSGVDKTIGLMTHFSSADQTELPINQIQIHKFNSIPLPKGTYVRSLANSAAILSFEESHKDVVRPGIMLYGVSPFIENYGREIGLKPVMHFRSAITAIHELAANSPVGYGGTWLSSNSSRVGIIPVGYGDGYPRHISKDTPVWVNGNICPIIGLVSMDMLAVDLTKALGTKIGDEVELWGCHIPVEVIAKAANTSPYELLCQVSPRVRDAGLT